MFLTYIKKHGANVLTLINMVLGLVAVVLAIQDKFALSSCFIILAALTDRFDGMFARKFQTTSVIGKYLDSNSDLISFGIAPGLLIYLSVLEQFEIIGIITSFVFIIAGAYRLARYNSETFAGYYAGLPITIGGALVAVFVFAVGHIPAWIFIPVIVTLSYLMVSKHSFKKV